MIQIKISGRVQVKILALSFKAPLQWEKWYPEREYAKDRIYRAFQGG